MTRLVFMGTPAFAVPTLRALAQQHTVVGVVTQPDRPAGRGRQITESAVKQAAQHLGLPIIQPLKLREPAAMAQLQAWQPELIVVAAFGQILKPAVLELPPYGCINVHASCLPRHRGAAPIPAAILAGDAETGVTIMQMDVGLDTGPMLACRTTPILPTDTTATLTERLAQLGATLLLEVLPAYLAGTLPPQPQADALATYAPQLEKEAGLLDFARPAVELERRIRAFTPWPGAYTYWQGQPFKIGQAQVVSGKPDAPDLAGAPPGTVVATPAGPAVVCGQESLLLVEVQPAGKKAMRAIDFARGARNFLGEKLG